MSMSESHHRRSLPFGLIASAILVLLASAILVIAGSNAIPMKEKDAKAAWTQIENQYQRRNDLIPDLVETVKGYASQETDVLTAVVEARAKATQLKISADQLTDQVAVQKFQAAQDQLSGSLSRLLATVEAYPVLKSSHHFLSLESELEGSENRISVARSDYIDAVRDYNTELERIPGRWYADVFYPNAKPMQSFTATPGAKEPPRVDVGQ
ncbi:LemA family protein [Jiella sp. MQZ9-1]|uniref:LemA family protein n=1 Tax=Jiella flava TaxID=2816857 RepID=A0A939FY39_9HYPH|nr:LemA family protein [Jiella flava]MBO0662128.1 LemA family protein [Jiella flava]MCD2470543.1 LemA family protein [Jiella flava]